MIESISFVYLANILQIVPPPLREIEVFSGIIDALNLRTKSSKTALLQLTDMQAILKLHPNTVAGSPATGKKRVQVTQYAEITIPLEMLDRFSGTPMTIEIGVSRRSCHWCDEWLSLAEKAIPRGKVHLIRRGTHGK